MTAQTHLVHGLGTEAVPAVWPPLEDGEVADVLDAYRASLGAPSGAGSPTVVWRSPRPMSAAALVRAPTGTVFVKRHHRRVRDGGHLAVEHAFAAHLRARRQPLPEVLTADDGATVVHRGPYCFEVHRVVPGEDRYRDVPSWYPYGSTADAAAAGRALAAFHLAAADFGAPARPAGVLVDTAEPLLADDPLAAVDLLVSGRPGLARSMEGRPVRRDLADALGGAVDGLGPMLRRLDARWGHGDWHPSNLTWAGDDPPVVVGVFDLALANRTSAVHDLAVAVERSGVDWLDRDRTGTVQADLLAVAALLDGYLAVRPLDALERRALVRLLPVVHVPYALSEVEYFGDVLGDQAAVAAAYDDYLVGHARWFATPLGRALLAHCRRCLDGGRPAAR